MIEKKDKKHVRGGTHACCFSFYQINIFGYTFLSFAGYFLILLLLASRLAFC